MSLSHFDEKSGIIQCKTPWGSWWQTVHDVHVEILLEPTVKSKDIKVTISPNFIQCSVLNNIILKVAVMNGANSDPITHIWGDGVYYFSFLAGDKMSIVSTARLGKPFSTVREDDSLWTIEDGDMGNRVLSIILTKADYVAKEKIWEALMADKSYQPDPMTFHEMRKKIDLEKFQLENPGMDFSKAKLQKCYDTIPGYPSSESLELQANKEDEEKAS